MRFTEAAWAATEDLRAAIHALPFVRELAAGTLSQARFRHYMLQDALYLSAYARVLALAAARAPDQATQGFFAGSAQTALAVERALHGTFLARFGVGAEEAAAAEPSPTCLAYTSFLLATAQAGSHEELLAAILPCFWIYLDVGRAIAASAAAENPYRAWIDTYADEGFAQAVAQARAACDAAAEGLSPARLALMQRAFRRAARYEWMFWESAWRLEGWPV